MTETDNPKEIFSRKRRRDVRDRGFSRAKGGDFLNIEMADEVVDRLTLVSRKFTRCLILGLAAEYLKVRLEQQHIYCVTADPSFKTVISNGGVQCDEDRLPFADSSFDLVISIGSLDTVNDLPGALTLIKRVLQPDGLFLGSFLGAGSLTTLKSILMLAEGDRVTTHIHPQIDIRTIGNLLLRAGFALPVADSDRLELKYKSMERLIEDIRNFGGSNVMIAGNNPSTKPILQKAKQVFRAKADQNGRISEFLELVHISGWAPHSTQPKPARRGSGQASLSQTLNDRAKS